MASKTVHSTNSSLIKPRTMSAVNQSSQARPTSPKITKRINSSSLVQPTNNFVPPRMNNITSRTSQQKSVIKKPTSTFHSSQSTKPLTINSSSNRLSVQPTSKLSNSRTSSSSSIIKGREPKKLVKDTISSSSFVPREKLEKLTKKHEELTNKYNLSSQVINRNQLAVDALSCLVNYMTVDLQAFECPSLRKRLDHMERVEQELKVNVSNLNAENENLNSELEFERHRSEKEKENMLEMFEVEMKSFEKSYQDSLKVEQTKREKAEKDLVYWKQNLSKDKKIDFLNKEIESLKTVLDLKDSEIKDLRYKLDRTVVCEDEISQLRNERDNLSLAKEQLEYSLNMKNEELKFVLQENTSLASLGSLTSTPLNNDRNNNVVKKRKNTVKKQKLDTNEKDDDNFLKPLNLHRDRFVKSSTDMVDNKATTNEYFDNDDEMNKSLDDDNHLNNRIDDDDNLNNRIDDNFGQALDEINFVKPLIDTEHSFAKPMSLDHNEDDHYKKSQEDDFRPQSVETIDKPMDSSSNKQLMDISLDKSFDDNRSFYRSFDRSSSKSFNKSFNKSSNKSFDKSLDVREKSDEHSFARLVDRKENSVDAVLVRPFDINEIKERCFAKPIDRTSPVKQHSKEQSTIDKQCDDQSPVQQQSAHSGSFVKTCQILNDENEISIIKNKKLESVLDSGFCDL